MFKDIVVNCYTPCEGYSCVLLEQEKSLTPPASVRLHSMLMDFVDKVRAKRPTWQFKNTLPSNYPGEYFVRSLRVFDGDEELGHVGLSYNWRTSDNHYEYRNHRIDKARQRGGSARTTKLTVLVTKVLREFYPLNIDELAAKRASDARALVYQNRNKHNNAHAKAISSVREAALKYFTANWETARHLLPESAAAIDLRTLEQAYNEAAAMVDTIPAATLVISRTDGRFVISSSGGDNARTISFAEMDDNMRAKLGMLKLIEDEAAVPDIGVRLDAATFLVFP